MYGIKKIRIDSRFGTLMNDHGSFTARDGVIDYTITTYCVFLMITAVPTFLRGVIKWIDKQRIPILDYHGSLSARDVIDHTITDEQCFILRKKY